MMMKKKKKCLIKIYACILQYFKFNIKQLTTHISIHICLFVNEEVSYLILYYILFYMETVLIKVKSYDTITYIYNSYLIYNLFIIILLYRCF